MDKVSYLRRRDILATMAAAGFAASAPAGAHAKKTKTSRRISFDARPAPVEFDLGDAALIVVDMQNDFGSEGGMFARAGIDISGIKAAVEPTRRVIAAARAAGVPVIYLKMGFADDLSDLGPPGAVNRERHERLNVGATVTAPDGSPSRILIRDTWNTAIVDALKPAPGDIEIWKTRFSGFYKTELDKTLRKLGATHLIVTGCTTSICVESTVRDAMFRDYRPILLADCMAEPIGEGLARGNHEASLLSTEVLLGWVSASGAFVAALAA